MNGPSTTVPDAWLLDAISVPLILDEAARLGLPLRCPDCPGKLQLLPEDKDDTAWQLVLPHHLSCPVINGATSYEDGPSAPPR